MYIVTIEKDIYCDNSDVEIIGVFDTEDKAYRAKRIVGDKATTMLGYGDCQIYVNPIVRNRIEWDEIDEHI